MLVREVVREAARQRASTPEALRDLIEEVVETNAMRNVARDCIDGIKYLLSSHRPRAEVEEGARRAEGILSHVKIPFIGSNTEEEKFLNG